MKFLDHPRQSSAIALAPLIGITLALALAVVPLLSKIAIWAVPAFFAAAGARLWMTRRGARLPSLPVKVVLFGLGVGGVAATFGTTLGIEPGLSILLVLVSLKLLETNSVRDFQVLSLLGYFLALCDLFFAQGLSLWLYVAAIVTLLTATLIRFHTGDSGRGYWRPTRLALTLFAQALPLVILLFLFFPRAYRGFRFQFGQSLIHTSAMSVRLSPGSIATLALGDQLVFRADFPDGRAPSMPAMYWRAGVLWQGEGLVWNRGPELSNERRFGQLGGPSIRQTFIVQPHGAHWLFALDRPASGVHGATTEPGGYLQSKRQISTQFSYEVISQPDNREMALPLDQREAALRKPGRVPRRAQALVNIWRAAHADDGELVQNALHFFRKEHFAYTLEPGTYSGADALDEFLFERRKGFCEHYAAAFATLMRVAGIPSRVVVGYHGGELNTFGGHKYVRVAQSEAHAWCEVWIKESGWLRVDPTQAIAPERTIFGLASYLERHPADDAAAGVSQSAAAAGWRDVARQVRLAWESVNYQWDLRVLNFDEDGQRNFLLTLGLGGARVSELLILLALAACVALAALSLWLRRPRRSRRDAAGESYARFCRRLASAGLPREPWEGPLHFGERAAARFAAHAAKIREITELYARLRYAPAPPNPGSLSRAVRAFPRLPGRAG